MLGSFSELSTVYDSKMYEPNNATTRNLNITMTAHVVIALATVKSLTGIAQAQTEVARNLATDYLIAHVNHLSEPYQTALTTWAIMLSRGDEANDAFSRLQKQARGGTYWSKYEIPRNPQRIVQTVPYMDPRQIYSHEGSAVQATAYALMCYTNRNYVADSVPIVDWLQSMRNTIGGFAGTRVTI